MISPASAAIFRPMSLYSEHFSSGSLLMLHKHIMSTLVELHESE